MVSEETFFKYFLVPFYCIMVSTATSTNVQWAKNIWLKQDFSRNIFIKVLSKYLQLLGSKCHFFNFPHYKSMENLSFHGIQPKEIIFIQNIKFVRLI